MAYLMGIDLGTSSLKTVIMDRDGHLLAICQKDYAFDIPRPGWAEQDPEVWWQAAVETIRGALAQASIRPADIDGIGFSGQMHGLVALDRNGSPVRKAILWCDQRSTAEVQAIEAHIGRCRLGEIAGSPIAAGFQTASLLWLIANEPDNATRIETLFLPKDYVRFRLTGERTTDITDAASTLALDIRSGGWSDELLREFGLSRAIYPPIHLPHDPAGTVTAPAAADTGLAPGTRVFHGGADQVMQAIGNGILSPGEVSVTIGTGGQVYAPLTGLFHDPLLRTHTFSGHLGNNWYFLGAELCAGLALRWLRQNVLNGIPYSTMDALAASVDRGSGGLIFLPYLAGERTPHLDPLARGLFFGLTLSHSQAHLIRAVMEGVVFGLRDCLDIYRELGQSCRRVIASGGGARSPLWLQIQADILDAEVHTSRMLEQAGVGAAIAAGVGAGIYRDYEEACQTVIQWNETPCRPDPEGVRRYAECHQLYRALYPATRELMHRSIG